MAQIPFGFNSLEAYNDPKYRSISLDVSGIIITFEENVDDKTKNDLKKALLMALVKALDNISSEGVSYPRLQSRIPDIQSMIRDNMKNSGFDIVDVNFNRLGPDEKSKARIAKFEEAEMFASNPQLLAQRMAEAQKAAESAASAPVAPSPVPGVRFCRNCGSPAGAGKYCTSCGSSLIP